MNVHLNRIPMNGPWGGGNQFVKAMYEQLPIKQCRTYEDFKNIDVVLIAGLDPESSCLGIEQLLNLRTQHSHLKFVIRVNENDARKGTNHVDKRLLNLFTQVDHVVFVSRWLQEYFVSRGWNNTKSSVIKNGVDRDVFKGGQKLNNGKINLVVHHWSSNVLKGSDIYEQLDEYVGQHNDKFSLTYIGRTNSNFKHTKVIQPLFGTALGEELGRYDVYISASRWDPGPNHVTESLSCGLPTFVHKDGGGCCDFIDNDPHFIYKDFDELIEKLNSPIPQQNVYLSSWHDCVRDFDDLMQKVCSNDSRGNV